MSIRVQTLLDKAKRPRAVIYRVRWRWRVPLGGGKFEAPESDGVEGEPESWARWEEEYFSQPRVARVAAERRWKGEGEGIIDSVPARDVLEMLRREGADLTPLKRGVARRILRGPGAPGVLMPVVRGRW